MKIFGMHDEQKSASTLRALTAGANKFDPYKD